MTLALFVLVSITGVALVILAVRSKSRAKEKRAQEAFAGRESLTPEAFYNQYFLNRGVAPEIVIGIRQILEEQLGVDMSRLRAEDDFSKNLHFFWDFDSLADVEIVLAIEEHFQIKIADAEAEKTYTIFDLVQLVATKVGRL